MGEDDLIVRCQGGDAKAFAELFDLHRPKVASLAFRLSGRQRDVDDLVQDVFLQVFRSIGRFRGGSRFSTWLHRVTVNVVLMERRARASRPLLISEEAAPEAVASVSPDEEVERHRRISAFFALLDRLSEKKRTVFILHDLEGMTPTEIAKVVESPLLTVRTRLFYARRELESMLSEEPSLAGLSSSGFRRATGNKGAL